MSEEVAKRPKLSKLDKAAIFLLSLGESDAAAILKHMGPKEVQRVGSAMAGLRTVHREQVIRPGWVWVQTAIFARC